MALPLPSSYPNGYWTIIQQKLKLIEVDPTLEKLLDVLPEISEVDRCPHAKCPPDMKKLEHIFRSYLKRDETLEKSLIQVISNFALKIDELFPEGNVDTLQALRPAVLHLSSDQIHCLLAHMFLGTFRCCTDGRYTKERHAYGPFSFASRMSFLDWYSINSFPTTDIYVRALLNLFEECILGTNNNNDIIFERRVLENEPDLSNCNLRLVKINVHSKGRIGDVEEAEVDFANACVGGGPGGTQEELLLGISPQALPIAIINAHPLRDNESIVITGVKKYADYKDYGLDAIYTRKNTQHWEWSSRIIIAIDAILFEGGTGENRYMQMQEKLLKREVNKCLVGLRAAKGLGVSTGHWGCGAFGGDKEIKAIIQVIAASIAEVKHLNFFTFGDETFAEQFTTMLGNLYQHDVRVDRLWDILLKECKRAKEPVTFKDKYDPEPFLFSKISSDLAKM